MTVPRWLAPAAVGALVFVVTRLLPGTSLSDDSFDSAQLQQLGEEIAGGAWPYRDVFVEYPPLGVPMVTLPAFLPEAWYGEGFQILQTLCGVVAIGGATALLAQTGADRRRLLAAAVVVGLSPVLLGALSVNRFDLWPTALVVVSLALVAAGHPAWGSAMLGLAALAKLYPLTLVPLVAAFVWRRWGMRSLLRASGAFTAVFIVVLTPLLPFAQDGLTNSVLFHRNRPLHLESVAGGILAAAEAWGNYDATFEFTFGSANLVGTMPDALAAVSNVAAAASVAAVCLLFVLGPATVDRFIAAAATTIAVAMLFGKVLSPQFAVWLIPLVPLVSGRLGRYAAVAFAACLIVTQPLYDRIEAAWRFESDAVAWLIARNALLAIVAALLIAATARGVSVIRVPAGSPLAPPTASTQSGRAKSTVRRRPR